MKGPSRGRTIVFFKGGGTNTVKVLQPSPPPQRIGIKGKEMTLVWDEKASRTA